MLAALTLIGAVLEFTVLASLITLLRKWLNDSGGAAGGSVILLFILAVMTAGGVRMGILALTQKLALDTGHSLIVAAQRRVLARDWPTHTASRGSSPLAALNYVEQWLHTTLLPMLEAGSAMILATGILASLLWYDAAAALAAAGPLALLFIATNLMVRRSLHQLGDKIGEGYDIRIATIQENVGAMRELILAGARGAAAERFRRIDRQFADSRIRLQILQGLPRILVESIGIAALAIAAWWIAGRQGGIAAALPTLAALGLGAQRLLPLLQTISHSANAMASGSAIQQRMAALLAEPDLDLSPPPPALPFAREISLEAVGFSYPKRDLPAVSGINLTIRKGERIALIGPNGSGKSTLADLVMGLLQPTSGRIFVDGVQLDHDRLPAWHRNIAHVPQAPFVANASITENIVFMNNPSDTQGVAEAVRLAGLDEMVANLPEGIDARVGDRGQLLSGGQRQRLALARALYALAPFLVLDEATSALDSESEAFLLDVLDELQRRGTTMLIIAHRETMLAGCDRVLRLEAGRLTPD